MTLFAPALSSLWRQLEDAGLEPEPLFRSQGLDSQVIFDPNARVPIAAADRIVAAAIEETGDEFFGMREADYFRPAHLGALGFAWLASGTLHDALGRLQRYARAINDKLEVLVEEHGDQLVVSLRERTDSLQPYHRDTGGLAVLARMCRFLCGEQWNPTRVQIAHRAPSDTSRFYGWFRCPVEFGADRNSLSMDASQAGRPVAGSDEHLAQLNDHIVVRYLAHRARGDIVNRTRAAILDSLGDGNASEAAVAQALHLSSRQLHRRLVDEETSFSQLLLECRRELAEQYISDSSLSLTEISYLLGFSEASSFSRAYRRWTGMSPTEARRVGSSGLSG